MIDVKNTKCETSGCTRIPAFNAHGEAHGRFCAEHRLPGMGDVRSKRCEASGCARTQPTFNLPELRPSHFSEHRQPGMIRNPRVRCTHPNCVEWSTHGRTGPLRCEAHALPTDTNLAERECGSCGLTMVLSCTGHCEFCDPSAARKRRRLAKQDEVKHYLAVHMPQHPPSSIDRALAELRACGDRERPDLLWDKGHLVVILEVDEEQHLGRACECEQMRMINVSQDLAAPRTLWIRYNPDAYSSPCVQVAPRTRLDTLRRVLLEAIDASPEACAGWPVIGVTQLSFDGFVSARATEVQSLDQFLV
jgi:hypothetical protein